MPNSFASLVESVEDFIRTGRLDHAQAVLEGYAVKEVPRGQAATLASLARRAGVADLGARLLHPIVRLKIAIGNVTPSERAEYAACLVDIGAVDEAESLLRRIEPAEVPDVNYFRANALLARDDHHGAIPLLQQHSADRRVREYPRAIGKIALVEALVHDRQPSKAAALVEDLVDDSLFRRDSLLMARALLGLAKNSVFGRKWDDARVLLARAREQVQRVGGVDLEAVENWECFLETRRSGNLETLHALRSRREKAERWSAVHDCDLIEALTTRDTGIAERLFFGSASARFRERLTEMVACDWKDAGHYVWNVEGGASAPTDVLDLEMAEEGANESSLLTALCSEFQRPIPIPSLYFRLHPEGQYHPRASAEAVREALARLVTWFEAKAYPLYVEQVGHAFRLRGRTPFAIRVPNPGAPKAMAETMLLKWRHRFGHEPFGVGQAAAEIDASERATRALLEQAESEGMVVREEGGRRTQFRIS